MTRVTVYDANPADAASRFERDGAALIHIVDLDGAIASEPRTLDAVARIRAAVRCAIDVSGGLRTIETVREVITAGARADPLAPAATAAPPAGSRGARGADFHGGVGTYIAPDP